MAGRGLLAAVLTAVVMLAGGAEAARPRTDPPPAGITLTGLDAHDGTIVRDGDTFYLYGTRYGCGFSWGTPNTPFCGFGVWSSAGLAGPWTFIRNLFPTTDGDYAWGWQTWNWVCGNRGGGCFNPRMVRRFDGVWILYFNAPDDSARGAASVYYAMGCVGPAGPCGDTAGGSGSTRRMPVGVCRTPKNGDFTIFTDGPNAYLACSDNKISVEQLDPWWTSGSGAGVRDIAGLVGTETPGVYRAPDGEWVMTLSDSNCGYCAGTSTAYVVAASPLWPWSAPADPGASAPPAGRGRISGNSCGGQPRTVFVVDGLPWQLIDTWYGSPNETNAAIRLEPLIATGPLTHPADGTPWGGGFQPFTCN